MESSIPATPAVEGSYPQPQRTISEELNHNNKTIDQRFINKALRNKIKSKRNHLFKYKEEYFLKN